MAAGSSEILPPQFSLDAVGETVDRASRNFVAGLHSRWLAIHGVPNDVAAFRLALADAGTTPALLALQVAATLLLVVGFYHMTVRALDERSAAGSPLRLLTHRACAGVMAMTIGLVFAYALSSGLTFRTLRLWSVVAASECVLLSFMRMVMVPGHGEDRSRSKRVRTFRRDVSIAIGWALIGVAVVGTLELWNVGLGLNELARTVGVGLPSYLLFAFAVWRHRRTMAAAVAGNRPRSHIRASFAKAWPSLVLGLLAITLISTQIALTMGSPLPGPAVVLTVMIFIAMPHLDVIIEDWAQRGLAVPAIPIVATAARQTTRFGLLIVTASLLGVIWAAPLAVGSGFELGGIVREAFEIAVIALVAAFLWNIVATMTVRASRYERLRLSGTPWATGLPRSRLGTIVPLMSAGGKTGIVAVALVAVLIILGFNVWPLITGLSVFGLAVGFGCQALVKDVVTGPFLLIDDSFRFGEHIETAGARGTVEKISIRSVSLRSDGGSIVTVPYGQIGNIENFSRDWATETLSFRVPFETDIHLLLSLLDEIGNGMAVDPELASGFLRPFRSTGISDVENSCLTITAEFTARPGRQAAIRRAALKAAQLGFKERGIRLVS